MALQTPWNISNTRIVPAISSLLPFQTSVARLCSIWVDVDADLEESRFVEIQVVMVDYT